MLQIKQTPPQKKHAFSCWSYGYDLYTCRKDVFRLIAKKMIHAWRMVYRAYRHIPQYSLVVVFSRSIYTCCTLEAYPVP